MSAAVIPHLPGSGALWMAVGLAGQALFSARFIVQWLVSERARNSIIPVSFWYLSVLGGLVLFVYSVERADPVFMLGQGMGLFVYGRNLYLLFHGGDRARRHGQPISQPTSQSSSQPSGQTNDRTNGHARTGPPAGQKSAPARFRRPRFWLTWGVIGLIRGIAHLPYPLQLRIGRGLGRVAHRLSGRYRHVAARNIAVCFPERTARSRQRLVQRHFESLGMAIMEMSHAWCASPDEIRARMDVSGLEHLHAAHAEGRGVLLLSGHFTAMELTGVMLSFTGLPVHTFYRPNSKNPLMEQVMRQGRARYAAGQIDRRDMRQLVTVLRSGDVVLWTSDHLVRPSKRSVLVPFFSEPALTHSGLLDVVRLTGARVVPFLPLRNDRTGRYEMRFLPALENFPTGDRYADMARVSRILEDRIRDDPSQYYWIRPRFARRPLPFRDIYAAQAPAVFTKPDIAADAQAR